MVFQASENFAVLPTIIKSAGVSLDGAVGNPAGSLRSDGNADWWYFTGSEWTAASFMFTYDIMFPSGSNTRDIANLAFWTTGLSGGTSNTTADGYMFRMDSGDPNSGLYQFTDGVHGTALGATAGITPARDTWYRVTITAEASTGACQVVVRVASTGTLWWDSGVRTLPAGNRTGTFGQKQDAAGSTEGSRWDNFALDIPPTTTTDTAAITVTESSAVIALTPIAQLPDDFNSALPDAIFSSITSDAGTTPSSAGGKAVLKYDTNAGTYKEISTGSKYYAIDTTGVTVEVTHWPTAMYGADDFDAAIFAWQTVNVRSAAGLFRIHVGGVNTTVDPANVRYINYSLSGSTLNIKLYDATGTQQGSTSAWTTGNYQSTSNVAFGIQYTPNGNADTWEIDRIFLGGPPTIKTGTESPAITISDSSALVRGYSGTDTAAISVADVSGTMVKSTTTTDTTAITVTESAASDISQSRTDTTAISVADVSSVTRQFGSTDSASISIADTTGTMVKSTTATDFAAVSVSETTAQFNTKTATDGAAVTISDASTVRFVVSAADTAAVSVADASVRSISLLGLDTIALSVNDQSFIFRTMVATDGAAISITESSLAALVVAKAGTDGAAISVSEARNIINYIPQEAYELLDVIDFSAPQVNVVHTIHSAVVVQAASDTREVVEIY